MQSDEVVWQIINHGHCSFKAKTDTQNFCRNEHNVTGLCNRSSCPLANSRYATIREHDGKVYLYIKTVERAHTPKKLWQKIRLSRNYTKALGQVDEHLAHWPKFLVHKNKQRLTKITQYLIRMRKLALKPRKVIITEPARLKKREARREVKAEKAADISNAIEKELLARLKSGTYGDIYNFPMTQYNRVLDAQSVPDGVEDEAVKGDGEAREDVESELDDESEEEMDYVEDLDESDDDMEDLAANWGHGEDNSDEDAEDAEEGSSDEDEESGDDSGDESGKGGRASKRPRAAAAGAQGKRPRREIETNIEHEPVERQQL